MRNIIQPFKKLIFKTQFQKVLVIILSKFLIFMISLKKKWLKIYPVFIFGITNMQYFFENIIIIVPTMRCM